MNPLRRLLSFSYLKSPLIEGRRTASAVRIRCGGASRRRGQFRPLAEALETRRVLSTFRVNTLLDTVAVNLKTGKDASGHISLRSAIEAANSKPNSDTILLPNGTIKLTILGPNEDNAATGDLDIKGNVTIKGKGASKSTIDANSIDRVFQVFSGRVQISGLTIQHGQADQGGQGVIAQGEIAGARGQPGVGLVEFQAAGGGGAIANRAWNGLGGQGIGNGDAAVEGAVAVFDLGRVVEIAGRRPLQGQPRQLFARARIALAGRLIEDVAILVDDLGASDVPKFAVRPLGPNQLQWLSFERIERDAGQVLGHECSQVVRPTALGLTIPFHRQSH